MRISRQTEHHEEDQKQAFSAQVALSLSQPRWGCWLSLAAPFGCRPLSRDGVQRNTTRSGCPFPLQLECSPEPQAPCECIRSRATRFLDVPVRDERHAEHRCEHHAIQQVTDDEFTPDERGALDGHVTHPKAIVRDALERDLHDRVRQIDRIGDCPRDSERL